MNKLPEEYNGWVLTDWHGNPELDHNGNPKLDQKCYKKQFGTGCVYVGVGDFLSVVITYDYHPDSGYISTRRFGDGFIISEIQAMNAVDLHKGLRLTYNLTRRLLRDEGLVGGGAPMGRPNIGKPPMWTNIYTDVVHIVDGYDSGGAYWGDGDELRVEYTEDLTYVKFYRTKSK